jgi:hypothetical protein
MLAAGLVERRWNSELWDEVRDEVQAQLTGRYESSNRRPLPHHRRDPGFRAGPLGFPFVLAHLDVEYLREVRRRDDRRVIDTGAEVLGDQKVVLGHGLRSADGHLVIVARSVTVASDPVARRSRLLTADERRLLAADAPRMRAPAAAAERP